jgi:hypothetical protein
MRLAQFSRLLTVLFLVGVLVGLPLIPMKVQARGGGFRRGGSFGGFHGAGRFGGYHGGSGYHGSFGGGSFVQAPHPRPGPHPQPGPHPGPHPPGPGPGPHPPHPPPPPPPPPPYGGWGPYYGSGWGAVAAGLAVGTIVGALSANAQPLVINNQTYYYDQGNYYQPCYRGSDSGYCVVPNPNE